MDINWIGIEIEYRYWNRTVTSDNVILGRNGIKESMIENGEEIEIDTGNIRAENNFVSKTFQEHK